MTKNLLFPLAFSLCLLCCNIVSAQEYQNTPVAVSTEKVRENGKVFYSHIVLEKQTLFSIAKAYGVSVQEISDANPKLNLLTEGPKKNQIILIPIKDSKPSEAVTDSNSKAGANTADTTSSKNKNIFTVIGGAVKNAAGGIQNAIDDLSKSPGQDKPQKDAEDYTIHTVKWYEDLDSVADKYKISKDIIIAFNGLPSPKIKRGTKLKIPKDPLVFNSTLESQKDSSAVVAIDSVSVADRIGNEIHEVEIPVERNYLRAVLLLPLDSSKDKVNDSNYDFYSGALLAMKDLADSGLNVDLSVYDISNSGIMATEEIYSSNDIILGPISLENMNDALDACPSDKIIISPLDPKTVSLANGTPNFIQAPSTVESQYNDIVEWIKEEIKPEDKLIVISEKNMAASPLAETISGSGLEYEDINYGILEGRDITALLERLMSQTSVNRIVITSESEAFINDVVRNLNIMIFQKYDVVLYGPSRIRNFETIEVENFHNAKLHVSSSYFIDYDNDKVKRFLMEYRALYGAEPTPFAYQGYDTAYYFLQKCAKGGIRWERTLDQERFKGLQSDFLFNKVPEGGYYNKAVRRIIYEGDYSIRIVDQNQ